MGALTVTLVSSTVALDPQRRGRAAFTVSNQGSHVIRARVKVVALGPAQGAWFTIEGNAERDFPAGITQQVRVLVAVPASVALGRYLFRVDVVGVQNPDEDSASGPAVAFELTGRVPVPPRRPTGYLATLSGAVLGALALGAVGAVPAALFALLSLSRTSVETVQTVLVVGGLLGSWAGAVGGAYVSLRIQGFEGAATTAGFLAIAYPIVAAPLAFGGIRLGGPLGLIVASLIFLTGPPLGARYLYIRLSHA